MVVSTSSNSPATPHVKAMNCPGCGAALTLRSFTQAVTVVCESCHSILDAQDPQLKILQQFKKATGENPPMIPLGTRGKIHGTPYEAVGFQRRTIHVDGTPYSWREYVLFNPYKGFRYLTEYNGHWNDISTLRALPTLNSFAGQVTVSYLGERYRHFQTAQAATTYVLGEFPWQVRVGETNEVTDYVSPPRVLSSEKSGKEITWSMGEYVSGRDIWKAFSLKGDPPAPIGVYENQPSPFSTDTKQIWMIFATFAILVVTMLIAFASLASYQEVFHGDYVFDTNSRAEPSFVTDPFELKGRTSTLELTTSTNVDNNWIYLNYALINQDTEKAYDFGREVSYYHGYDEDGSWTEGKRSDSVAIPSVPPGTYYLRVEPESDRGHGSIHYEVTAKRDVPQFSFFGIALLALLVPAALLTWRSINFEHMRWAESDHAPMISSDEGDDD
jgi:hypothetical protein